MTKRRRQTRQFIGQNPFSLYFDMFNVGMQMTKLATSSGQVIAHRSDMMARALKGEVPLHHKEFTDMWIEKMFATSESMAAAMKYMGASSHSNGSAIRGIMNMIAPFQKRSSANAKRLNRK